MDRRIDEVKNKVKKDRRMRMFWSSNGVWTNSGYGTYQRDLLARIAQDGWPVAQNAFWVLQGYPITIHFEDLIDDRFKGVKMKVYPIMADAWGADGMFNHGKDFKADVHFCMQDVWPLDPGILSQLKNFIPYVPVDKDPLPPMVGEKLKFAYKIISFSKFGHKVLENSGFYSNLILEGTDTEIFRPMDRVMCRTELKIPQNVFIFGMVAANKENPPRKGFQEAIQAFKLFQDKHPEACLLIHTQQPGPGGFPIMEFAKHIGVNMRGMLYLEPYRAIYGSDSKVVAKEMNAINVLLHPSQTEGFGLTVIEAAACGIPAIVTNTTSMPEMIIDGVTGEICKADVRRFTNDLSWVEAADIDDLYQKMETIYQKVTSEPAKVAVACRQHIINNYDINTQYKELWLPYLERLQSRILPSTV